MEMLGLGYLLCRSIEQSDDHAQSWQIGGKPLQV